MFNNLQLELTLQDSQSPMLFKRTQLEDTLPSPNHLTPLHWATPSPMLLRLSPTARLSHILMKLHTTLRVEQSPMWPEPKATERPCLIPKLHHQAHHMFQPQLPMSWPTVTPSLTSMFQPQTAMRPLLILLSQLLTDQRPMLSHQPQMDTLLILNNQLSPPPQLEQ